MGNHPIAPIDDLTQEVAGYQPATAFPDEDQSTIFLKGMSKELLERKVSNLIPPLRLTPEISKCFSIFACGFRSPSNQILHAEFVLCRRVFRRSLSRKSIPSI